MTAEGRSAVATSATAGRTEASGAPRRWRSALFMPANRPELVAKAPRAAADVVVLDLEDAVPASEKPAARPLARAGAESLLGLANGPSVLVRVNSPSSAWFAEDVTDGLAAGLAAVVVPKLETVEEADRVAAALDAAGLGGVGIVAGIETALGVADARPLLAHRRVVAGYFGAEDFTADMGGLRREDNAEVAYARAHVALAARLGGVPVLDIVVAAFGDEARFVRECAEARAMGYSGKLCIHPAQVKLANEAFTPGPEEIDRASRLLAAYEAAMAEGRGAIAFEGQMVDEPLAERARAVLRAAGES